MQRRAAVTTVALVAGALGVCLCIACSRSPGPPAPQALTVYAAASLADAFREIGGAFEAANPGARIEFSFAGSNQLRTQLEQGAPADVFVSADRRQMDGAVASGVVDATTVIVIAHNELAILVPRENPGGIDALADLGRAGLKIVVADRSVPVGHATLLMLEAARASSDLGPAFVDAFDANTVSHEENVAAVVAKVALNEADAGIAYVTDGAGRNRSRVTVVAIPPGLNHRSEDVAGVVARAPDPVLGARFLAFVRSDVAAAILVDHGFTAPGPGSP